jgi:hypothetical protein
VLAISRNGSAPHAVRMAFCHPDYRDQSRASRRVTSRPSGGQTTGAADVPVVSPFKSTDRSVAGRRGFGTNWSYCPRTAAAGVSAEVQNLVAAIAILSGSMEPPVYRPLAVYLSAIQADEVQLSFEDIERILGRPLPRGASISAWWANTRSTVQARAWLGVGWRASARRIAERLIIFTRQ